MAEKFDTEVLIVGGGPTGLTLAIDLRLRGVRCTLIERKGAPQFLPKMERCNARTMEIFRRMGVSEKIRSVGLPATCPMDVFIVLSCAKPPLLHLPYPSVAQFRDQIATCNDAHLPLEPYQLISQYTLEPLLKGVAEQAGADVHFGCELVDFAQDECGVSARVRLGDRRINTIRARYLVGCDGGTSTVRRQLGIEMRGEENLLELRQALYRCDDLYERIPIGKGRHYHVADDRFTFLIVQDSTKHFTLHAVVETDADMAGQFERTVGMPVEYEMLYVGRWKQNLLLADRYRDRRVFLAGDAAHLVIPTGGLGMNTGVGDAIDLSWKLAATLRGWAGPKLLDAYETERRQVGARNVQASTFASRGRRKWRAMYRPNIGESTPEAARRRAELAAVADVEQRKTNEMVGAELGYRYEASPLIIEEEGDAPPHDFMEYKPTTWPGSRLPHVWLTDGAAVQDRIGYDQGYTLLSLGGIQPDTERMAAAFRQIGAPFRCLRLQDQRARDVYGHDLMLVRPDMHVVWRGNALESAPESLARQATGH